MPWPKVHDDRIVASLIGLLAAAAWCVLWLEGNSPWGHALLHAGHAQRMGINRAMLAGIFVLGWTVMTIAMMLPTSSPLVLLFHRMVAAREFANWFTLVLISGYLAVWASFGFLIYGANCGIAALTENFPGVAENRQLRGGSVLLIAGIYQFSSLKYACLAKCRSPLIFLVERWRGIHPVSNAFRLGVSHGIYCVGCCWSLMLLMFVTSSASLLWMLLLGALMAAEKNFAWGRRLSVPVGVVLVTGGVIILWQALVPHFSVPPRV